MMTQSKISVAEALRMIDEGKSINDFFIDFEKIKVESLDVMKLAKHGVNVPDSSIYYDDEDIIEDDEFADNWQEIDYDPIEELASQKEVKITVKKDIQKWLERKNIHLDDLMENLLDNFYQSQKMIEKE